MTEKLIILAAPSGAGKNTFIDKALDLFPMLRDVTTFTTRSMRTGEKEGDPYHFVSEKEFKKLIEQDFFVEWANVHVYHYGTPWDELRWNWARKRAVIMDLDVQGAQTFREKFPQCLTVFIQPPSLEALKERILKREGQLPHDIDVRMQSAEVEMKRAKEFDVQIINDDFDKAFLEFTNVLAAYLKND
jgi:guanylate kinase